MMAYLVDAETAEQRPSINDQLRAHDLEIAYENVVGGLLDLQAAEPGAHRGDPVAIADELRDRYEELWEELTRTDRFDSGERWRIDDRLRRINELGFDVEELAIRSADGGNDPRHHPGPGRGGPPRPGAAAEHRPPGPGEPGPPALGRHRELPGPARAGRGEPPSRPPWAPPGGWTRSTSRSSAPSPAELAGRLEPAELFHEMLDHRHAMAERAGREITNPEALADYLTTVLPDRPEEKRLLE